MTLRWWRLAGRNLLRHRRRTLLTGSIVVVGFVATTMTAGFVAQTFRSLGEASVRNLGGHLRVFHPDAEGKTDDEAMAHLLPRWDEVAAIAAKDPDVVQAMPRLAFFGLVVKGEKSAAYLGTGTVPALETRAAATAETMVSGRFLPDAEAEEVVLGSGLARSIGASTGDLVTVMTTTPDGALNAVDATVTGLLTHPVREVDDRVLYMPYAASARLLKAGGKASAVVVLLRKGAPLEEAASSLAARLAAAGRPASIKTWIESAPFYRQVRLLYAAIFLFTGLVLAVVVVLAAANTMTMSVFERTREIGTLLAIGMDRRDVARLFVAEGLLLGLSGSAIGALASLLLRAVLNASGIEIPPPPGATHGSTLHVDFIPLAYAAGFTLMTTTLLLATLWPARRAAGMNPVEALAHV